MKIFQAQHMVAAGGVCLCEDCARLSHKHGYGPTVARIIYLVCVQWEANLVSIKVDENLRDHFFEDNATMDRVRKRALAAMNDPKNHKTGEIAVQTITMSVTELAKSFIDNAWNSLEEEERADLRKRVAQTLSKNLQSGQLEPRLRETIMHFTVELLEKELEVRTEQIRAKVVAELEARWAEQVEKLVQTKVTQAIDKIRQEMLR